MFLRLPEKPARVVLEWVLACVRPVEVRRAVLTLDVLRDTFPDARAPRPEHFTHRLTGHDAAAAFCKIVRAYP